MRVLPHSQCFKPLAICVNNEDACTIINDLFGHLDHMSEQSIHFANSEKLPPPEVSTGQEIEAALQAAASTVLFCHPTWHSIVPPFIGHKKTCDDREHSRLRTDKSIYTQHHRKFFDKPMINCPPFNRPQLP